MVNNPAGLDATFAALADPTRRAILARLARGESTVSGLAGPFDISLPAVSKHLKVLEGAGLLRRAIEGRVHRCRIDPRPLKEAAAWISRYRRFWEERLDALERYLMETHAPGNRRKEDTWPPRRQGRRARSASAGRFRRGGRRSSGPGRTRKP